MKYLATWSVKPGKLRETVLRWIKERAQSSQAAPGEVKMLGPWYAVDGTGVWALMESDRPEPVYDLVISWAELLDFRIVPVFTDEEALVRWAKVYGK